jgi:hypothetical protein
MEELEESRGATRLMTRRANMYMKVKHGKERNLVYLGAYVATTFRDTGLVKITKATG